jgi:carbonic anhydrase
MSVTDDYLANNTRYARIQRPAADAASQPHCGCRLHGRQAQRLRDARAERGRGARHPQRGRVVTDDVIRSLAISQRPLGTREIMLIHHTDCGMLTFTDDAFKRSV